MLIRQGEMHWEKLWDFIWITFVKDFGNCFMLSFGNFVRLKFNYINH